MSNEDKPAEVISPWAKRRPVDADRPRRRIGMVITIGYLLFIAIYVFVTRDKLIASKPSEFGDFLAGVFAPLAFLWLVLGFFQQGDELRQSSEALWLQGQELQNSVEQQRELVNVTREQLDFERHRIEADAERLNRQAQPDFAVLGGGHSGSSGGVRTMTFELLNRGAKCTDFVFTTEGRMVRQSPLFDSNAKLPFSIDVAPTDPLGPREFEAAFTDALGNRQTRRLTFEVVQNGQVRTMRGPTSQRG